MNEVKSLHGGKILYELVRWIQEKKGMSKAAIARAMGVTRMGLEGAFDQEYPSLRYFLMISPLLEYPAFFHLMDDASVHELQKKRPELYERLFPKQMRYDLSEKTLKQLQLRMSNIEMRVSDLENTT